MMHLKPTIAALLSNAPAQICVKDLLGAARRLVFSHVNQALCRIYQETDPSLGKLIRNLMLAVKTSSCFSLMQREGQVWICLAPENEAAASLPVMPPEFLEAHLTASLHGEVCLKQVLALLVEILDDRTYLNRHYFHGSYHRRYVWSMVGLIQLPKRLWEKHVRCPRTI